MTQDSSHGWDSGWDEHKLRQMQRMAAWPLTKKLEWLEEAHRLVLAFQNGKKTDEQVAQPESGRHSD